MKPESSKAPLPPQVEAWLSEQPPSERHSLEETWRLSEGALPAMDAADRLRKDEVRAAVFGALDESREELPHPRLRLVRPAAWRWMAAAAAAVLLLGVGYLLRPVTVHAPNGEFARATLPDGSTVQLNSGSTITYRAAFFGTRRVELRGEAYFDVVKDDDAFVVETFNARTTVLGTEFNVRARPEEATPATSVVVVSGRVRVSAKTYGEPSVVVTRGLRTTVSRSDNPSEPIEVLVDREVVWRQGGLGFTDQPFSSIFAELERRFDLEIESDPTITAKPFSYYKHDPVSAEAVVSDLAQAAGLRYRETANGFEIYRP